MSDGGESALAPLHHARDALDTLRFGPADPESAREAILRVADAAEASLRRLLRASEDVPLPVRLRALAPDELPPELLIAELRQRDLISIELAASFHDLLRTCHRLIEGMAAPADADVALRVAEQTEREVLALRPGSFAVGPDPAESLPVSAEASAIHAVPPAASVRRSSAPAWIAGGVAMLALVLFGVWMAAGRLGGGEAEMNEAITLFRSGDVAAAALLFRSYAEANPNDVTPRLYLARIHRRAERFEEAREELRQALAIAPDDPAVQRELAFLLLDGGQHEAAIERFRFVVELDPESPEGWIGLIRALGESGQRDAADRVLARAPDEVRALVRQPSP